MMVTKNGPKAGEMILPAEIPPQFTPEQFEAACRDLRREIDMKMIATKGRFFGTFKLELTFQNGACSLFRIGAEQTNRFEVEA